MVFGARRGEEGRDRRKASSGDREERERKGHVGVGGGRVRCSRSQAHSSCSACWDALGSVLHNTITACSGVLCSAPLCSDYLLLDFLSSSSLVSQFACFLLHSFFFLPLFSGTFQLFFFFSCAFLNLLVDLALKQSFELSISISSTVVFVFKLGF